MNPKAYETLAGHHIDSVRRDVSGAHRLAVRQGRPADPSPIWRWLTVRLASVRRRRPIHVARPGGDLRSPGRAQLRQDVLDVGARRLRRDPE
jgi:hypothetical protein